MFSKLTKVFYILTGFFLAGATLATFITLLFAPKSGPETRKQIANLAKKATSRQGQLLTRMSRGVMKIKAKKEPKSWFERLVA